MATAPTFTPAEIAIGQQFFSSNPTGAQIYEKASEIGLSPEQTAGLYQQSMGGDYGNILNIVNTYLGGQGASLPGGYQSGLLGDSGNAGASTINTGVPTFNWSPAEIDIGKAFFSSNPTAEDIYSKANQYGLSAEQLASLYQASVGGNANDFLPVIQDYLSGTGQSLGGGYKLGTGQSLGGGYKLGTAKPIGTLNPTLNDIVNQISGTPITPQTINQRQAIGDYDTSNYFERYFPVTVSGGRTNPLGQLSTTMPNFTQADIDLARQFFSSNPTGEQIYQKAREIGLTPQQLAGVYQQSMGGDYNEILDLVNTYVGEPGRSLPGGYQGSISGLDAIIANIQAQYTPQQFTHSGGSYGAGRFLPADMAPTSVNGFTQDQVSAAKEFFSQVTDPQQIFTRANELGLSAPQLADLYSRATGANYGDTLDLINTWSAGNNQTLTGGYKPSSNPLFVPSSFDDFQKSQVNNSLVKDLTAEVDKIIESSSVESGGDTGSGKTIGTGAVTDAINKDALNAAIRGFLSGGPISAVLNAAVKAGVSKEKVLQIVNQQEDPLGFLAGLQGWTPDTTPAPVYTAEQLNANQAFWASNPTPDEIVNAMEVNKMTPEQVAEAWSIATGGNKQVGLDALNQYVASQSIQPEAIYDARLDQGSPQYDPALFNRVMAGVIENGGTITSSERSGFIPTGLLDTGVVVGGPIAGDLQTTTPLGPLSGGDSSLTKGWTSSDWSRDYTSEFGG